MMRCWLTLVLALVCATSVHAAAPSEASVDALLAATRAERLVDAMGADVDRLVSQAVANASAGKQLSPNQQQIMQTTRARLIQVMRDELDWNKLHPLYVQIYQETFTQEEIDGLIAFYNSPAGEAMVNKMPAVMQKTMAMMQSRMAPMMAKIDAAVKQAQDAASAAEQ